MSLYSEWERNLNRSLSLTALHALLEPSAVVPDPDYIWVGVRGSEYHQDALKQVRAGMAVGELKVDPQNGHDPLAVSILVKGKLIGYLPATMARYYFTPISFLEQADHCRRIIVEVTHPTEEELEAQVESAYELGLKGKELEEFLYSPSGAHEKVPALQLLEMLVPEKMIFSTLEPLWEQLPEKLKEQIIKDWFYLSETTGPEFWQHKKLAPDYPFKSRFDPSRYESGVAYFLNNVRKIRSEKIKKDRKERNLKIVRLREQGKSYSEIGRLVNLSPGTVSDIVRKALKESK